MHPGIDDLLTILRFPSVSTKPENKPDVQQCADWLQAKLKEIGLATEQHQTAGHPVVLARNLHKPGRKTVMIYGHYDVQPPEPLNEWRSPAFEPTIVDGRIYCRGSTDNKGQLMAHVRGVQETLAAHNDLPVNLIFLFEGEEEIGSPHLKPFLEAHKQALQCDLVAISDTGMVAPGMGTFTYGLRGIACLEAIVSGPSIDLHSGIFGGAIANPATAAARLVATLHHPDGKVAVEGFYDDVRPLQEWERLAWQKLGDSTAETLALTGSPSLFGEPGYTDLERRWARPTVEVNGIGGGYQGAGSKTVIPREAMFKLSMRLVPDQKSEVILGLVKAHLEKHLPTGTRLSVHLGHTGLPYVMDPHSKLGVAAQNALKATFGDQQDIALIREGGSIPIVQAFKDVLGVETLLLGLALPDCQAHAPNENFPLASYEAGVRLNQRLLEELAKV